MKITRIVQCMRAKRSSTCALPAGHKGPCGFDRREAVQDVAWDEKRHSKITKLHRADANRN